MQAFGMEAQRVLDPKTIALAVAGGWSGECQWRRLRLPHCGVGAPGDSRVTLIYVCHFRFRTKS